LKSPPGCKTLIENETEAPTEIVASLMAAAYARLALRATA
jgi:hypothetical protein